MEPGRIRFGGGASVTLLHPVVAIWMLIAIVLILTAPRKKALIPFLFAVLTIPIGQVVLIGGLHFTMMRVLSLAGLVRAGMLKASSKERWFPTGFNRIDQLSGGGAVDGVGVHRHHAAMDEIPRCWSRAWQNVSGRAGRLRGGEDFHRR